jgi:hypothetical protein
LLFGQHGVVRFLVQVGGDDDVSSASSRSGPG